jgi:hypothetical protein
MREGNAKAEVGAAQITASILGTVSSTFVDVFRQSRAISLAL